MNTLTATIKFDYKGEHYELSTLINVDNFIDHEDFYQSVCLAIAKNNNVGLYTYELEIMMDQAITFTDATGYALGCIDNNDINLDCLRKQQSDYLLKPVINDLINQYGLDANDKNIYNALIHAFQEGEKK
ncbi:MAG: hypothetical protein ISR74_05835 [Candidatus Thioglobus sp.]|nr:hypothetical protein [Candidatus Thioglobus pontius]MBL6985101.1 hypothetical protein [Candidatus Thioglobus sp.]